jgi:subtilisin family serine protease
VSQFSRLSLSLVALLGVVALDACTDAPTVAPAAAPSLRKASVGTGEFMILGADGALPSDIGESVSAAGGTVVRDYPELGLAVAVANSAGFAARAAAISGVESVAEDRMMQLIDPNMRVVEFAGLEAEPTEEVASIADNEPLYALQWAPAAINAPEAWNAGYTGRGVRVAILDGGLFNTHPDLAAQIDAAASRSFVPGFAYNTDVGTFWHGTHVAGIVAAGDNTTGVIGIAPHATLIGVKVLHNGTGSFSWLIDGVLYASRSQADGGAGAQIINMSLGALIEDAKDKEIKKDVKELTKALDRAMSFAWKHGVTVIAAAGNDYLNLDAAKTAISIPAMSQHVISISATAPINWASGNRDFARLASYSNWGKAVVDLAAPGGDFAYPGNENCTVLITNPCWVFDMYLSTSRAGYTWAAGTSMASPVAAGVAALIIEKAGGDISPALVEAELRRGALDLGKPGNDAVYGHGWVNAYGSVK